MEGKSIVIDYFKAFLMTCVILGHIIYEDPNPPIFFSVIFNIICSFHMPVFFAISGYLISKTALKNERWGAFWRKYLKKFIIPFLFALILEKWLISPNWAFFVWSLKFGGQLWFIATLFFLILLLKIGYTLNFSKTQQIFLYSFFALIFLIDNLTIQSFLVFYFEPAYFPFFLIGHYWNEIKSKLSKVYTFIFVIAWIFRLISIFLENEMFGIPRLFTMIFTTLICINFIHNRAQGIRVKKIKFFISYGRNTMPVYLYHYLFIIFALSHFSDLGYYLFTLSCSSILIVSIFILSKICKSDRVIWLFGIRPQINYWEDGIEVTSKDQKIALSHN